MTRLYPGSLQIPAMLISKAPTNYEKVIAGNDYLAQQKIDGYWEMLEKTDTGEIYMFSRSKSKKTGELTEKIDHVPHIQEWAKNNLPNGTIIIGEVFIPNGTSKDCTKILGCLAPKAIQRQEQQGYLYYYIHDCLKWNGKMIDNQPYIDRYNKLYNAGLFVNYESPSCKQITLAKNYYNNFQEVTTNIFASGGEGLVYKKKNLPYRAGKRPKEFFKIKQEDSFDAVITGFVEPKKEYTGKELDTWQYYVDGEPVTKAYYNGWKAGVYISAFDGPKLVSFGTISSGFTDEDLRLMAEEPDKFLGQVAEFQCMSLNKEDHTVRHGRFIQMRPDKDASECTIAEIF